MQNIKIEKEGSTLIIKIDLAAPGVPSKTGKTTVIATTRGNINVPSTDGVKLGVNCYK
jgi:hypothetical protein